MKKVYVPLFVITMVIVTVGIWIFQSDQNPDAVSKVPEILQVSIIVVLFALGLILAVKRIKSIKHGLPVEDEMSRKVRQKSAAWSYYFSIYVWVAALYLYHESDLEGNVLIGGGILIMALLFGIFNLIFSNFGNSHD